MATKQASKTAVATKGAPAEQEKTKSTAVAHHKPAGGQLAAPASMAEDMFADAGRGLENVDADSIAIPFLAILQSNSPQVDPDDGEYIPSAKAGMIFNTVTKEVFDGKEGVLFIPCDYQRKFLRWAPREAGGGFKGEIAQNDVTRMRESGDLVELENRLYVPDDSGSINPKKNDKVSDTRVHYVLMLNPRTGVAQQAVISLGSTQIKKSKQLISLLLGVVMEDPKSGQKANPPGFANVVRLSTVPESNDKGKWSGVKFELQGFVQDANTYRMARGFHMMIKGGKAAVNFDTPGAGVAAAEGGEESAPAARGSRRGEGF